MFLNHLTKAIEAARLLMEQQEAYEAALALLPKQLTFDFN